MNFQALSERNNFFRCPDCKMGDIKFCDNSTDGLICSNCGTIFPILLDQFICMLPKSGISDTKKRIQEFWGDICKQWYTKFDENLTSEMLYDYLDDLKEMFKCRMHLAVTEMEVNTLKGKSVLEIGSGGGAHSALFKRYGAHVTSVDITIERVVSTAKKLSLIKEGTGLSLQADAETLPFMDNSFDIVYSNGVLHHSENTEKCIEEVRRVLKPNGKAVIMLYSRYSALYWLNLLPRTILYGLIFNVPEAERIGIITEGRPKHQDSKNPITRIYSKKQILSLFKDFNVESIRKNSFSFSQLPVAARIRPLIMKGLGYKLWKSGTIVYGAPNYAETRLELMIGKYFGFAWNVIASKR